MGTFAEKILGGRAGTVVTVEPDYIVINDGVSHAAVDEITAVAAPEKVLVIYDHDVPTGRPEAAAVLRKNLKFADDYNCRYIQAEGICYQYMLRHLVKPGQIVIGGGSHGSIFGARGAMGINVSIPELARVTETGRYSLVVPETISVIFTGELAKGVSVMDAAFCYLKSAHGIKRKAVEFYCPQLSQHEKEVLCSMACLTGAFTAGIAEEKPVLAQTLDLSQVKPMIMMPCSAREEQGKAELCEKDVVAGIELNAGQIGGYTGGTIEELRKAAELMEGKKLSLGFRLSICPATSQDYLQAADEGLLEKFIDFGAQIHGAGDHSVVVQGPGAMGPREKLITTGLYTFAGAMGCDDAQIYSGSVETVMEAAAAKRM